VRIEVLRPETNLLVRGQDNALRSNWGWRLGRGDGLGLMCAGGNMNLNHCLDSIYSR